MLYNRRNSVRNFRPGGTLLRLIGTLLTIGAMILALMALACLPCVGAEPVPPGTVLYLPLVLSARPVPTPTATLDPILEERETPELVSPSSGIQVNTLAPELVWRSASDHWFGIEIATDPQFSTLAVSVPPRSHCGGPDYTLMLLDNLEPATLYYWRVGYDDDTGFFTWSPTWWFTTPDAGGSVPPAPEPALPEDGSTVASLSPCLSWQGLDGANMYHITLGVRDSIFTFSVLSPTPGQLVPFQLLPGRTYAWHVRAYNGYGWGPESTTWLFQTPDD
jgi:hypothetical protein